MFGSAVSFLRACWTWLLKNPIALVSALSAGFGAWLVYRSRKRTVPSLESALEIQAHTRKIAKHDTEAARLVGRAGDHNAEIDRLRAEIAASKRRVVEIEHQRSIVEMSDVEVAAAFTHLGY
jgi:uncharacterized protein HemX